MSAALIQSHKIQLYHILKQESHVKMYHSHRVGSITKTRDIEVCVHENVFSKITSN